MSRMLLLSDALIRAAFAPEPGPAESEASLTVIAAEIRRTPQRRRLLRWPWASDLGVPASLVPPRRLAWAALIVVALLTTFLVGLIVGSALLDRTPRIRLASTGMETLAPESTGYETVVVDGRGTAWATGPGHVTRFDPATGSRKTWTVSDDAAFASSTVAAARAGGIWIWHSGTIRRFDGVGFVEVLPEPIATLDPLLAEAPGGSLWAAGSAGGPWRWDGSTWRGTPGSREVDGASRLIVLADDDVWVLYSGTAWRSVAHFDGDRWTRFDAIDVRPLSDRYAHIAAGPDRTLWVASNRTLSRFVAGAWVEVDYPASVVIEDLAVGPDGAVWALSDEEPAEVARLQDGVWTSFRSTDGLPERDASGIAATDAGVFLGSIDGLYRFDDASWASVWPDAARGPTQGGGRFRVDLVAVDANEAWALDAEGVWHFGDGHWTGPITPDDTLSAPTSIALGPDGTLVATMDQRVVLRRDGRWTTAWRGESRAVAPAPDGSIWIVAGPFALVQLRPAGDEWRARTIECPTAMSIVAVTSDGSIWTGGAGWTGWGLSRFDGRTCREVFPLGRGHPIQVVDLAADPTGGLVAAVIEGSGHGRASIVRCDDGRWSTLRQAEVESWFGDLAVGPSGDVWLAGSGPGGAMERYQDGEWRVVAGAIPALGPVSIASDGTVLFAGPSGVQRLAADEASG